MYKILLKNTVFYQYFMCTSQKVNEIKFPSNYIFRGRLYIYLICESRLLRHYLDMLLVAMSGCSKFVLCILAEIHNGHTTKFRRNTFFELMFVAVVPYRKSKIFYIRNYSLHFMM